MGVAQRSGAIAAPEPAFQVHFGGPDLPPKALRDLLQSRIAATPAGAAITWNTYYFRDRALAQALVDARQRGVLVRVIIEACPRRRGTNAGVIALLSSGLGEHFRLHRARLVNARLHAKIYAFSGPAPETFIGSFNPSGDMPEDAGVVAEIGDQDRGHNLLVAFRDPADAAALHAHALRVWRSGGLSRFRPAQNRVLPLRTAKAFFYPRLRVGVVERELATLRRGDVLRAAVSHLRPGAFSRRLVQAAARGARVELVVHDTRRRVPQRVVESLATAGVAVLRYCHPEGLPMHCKFVLLERAGGETAFVGSLNYNFKSQVLNQEILVRTEDAAVIQALRSRFEVIRRQAAEMATP